MCACVCVQTASTVQKNVAIADTQSAVVVQAVAQCAVGVVEPESVSLCVRRRRTMGQRCAAGREFPDAVDGRGWP